MVSASENVSLVPEQLTDTTCEARHPDVPTP